MSVDGKPDWDHRTRVNFEELWGDGDTKAMAKALRATRTGSPTKGVLTWADEQGEVRLSISLHQPQANFCEIVHQFFSP